MRGSSRGSRYSRFRGSSPEDPKLPESIREFRRSLFRKRPDTFLDLGAAHAVAMAAVGGLLVQFAAGEFVDRALHAAHRNRRIAGEYRSKLVDFLIERFGWHHRGEITDPQHLGGADLLRRQKQLPGVVGAEPRHIAFDAALVIMQPEPRRGHEHLAAVDAD